MGNGRISFKRRLSNGVPLDSRQNGIASNVVCMFTNDQKHRLDQGMGEQMGLQSQVQKVLMGWIVVVLFGFRPRVEQVLDRHLKA